MLYFLDASALITAHNTYYAHHRVPEFWRWLLHHGAAGTVKLPREIYQEVEDGNDVLAKWMGQPDTRQALRFDAEADPELLQLVTDLYGDNLTDADIEMIGKDPFLVAAALQLPAERCVVTNEVSKPARTGPRRHIPNICNDCGVQVMNPIEFLNALDFTTGWQQD